MSQLSRLGVGGEWSELVSEGDDASDEGGNDEIVKSPTAQDFADIAEVWAYMCGTPLPWSVGVVITACR